MIRNSVIIPRYYEQMLYYIGEKEGLIKSIDYGIPEPGCSLEELIYKRYSSQRQQFFQTDHPSDMFFQPS